MRDRPDSQWASSFPCLVSGGPERGASAPRSSELPEGSLSGEAGALPVGVSSLDLAWRCDASGPFDRDFAMPRALLVEATREARERTEAMILWLWAAISLLSMLIGLTYWLALLTAASALTGVALSCAFFLLWLHGHEDFLFRVCAEAERPRVE